MRSLKYFSILILSVFLLNSCFEDPDYDISLNGEGNNTAGFADARKTLAAIADGTEYEFELLVKVVGPTSMNMSDDVTMTFGADASSTAIEGTHFRIDNPSITLKADNNYLGIVSVTMLTDGIVAPLDESPVLVLKATDATGTSSVVASGNTMELTLNYACPSVLAGAYDVTMIYTAYDGTVSTINRSVTIAETGVGEYRTSHVGHWGILGAGTEGFTFYDVCDVITVPSQNLVDWYANMVAGEELGSVKPDGSLHMKYSICYDGNCRYYDVTYVPTGK